MSEESDLEGPDTRVLRLQGRLYAIEIIIGMLGRNSLDLQATIITALDLAAAVTIKGEQPEEQRRGQIMLAGIQEASERIRSVIASE